MVETDGGLRIRPIPEEADPIRDFFPRRDGTDAVVECSRSGSGAQCTCARHESGRLPRRVLVMGPRPMRPRPV